MLLLYNRLTLSQTTASERNAKFLLFKVVRRFPSIMTLLVEATQERCALETIIELMIDDWRPPCFPCVTTMTF